jgi:outer membrane immunogenic protein
MRCLFLSAALIALVPSGSVAADLTVADVVQEFAPQENFSWTGAYVGLFGGFAVGDIEVTDRDGYNGDPGRSFDYRVDGFYGGGLAGYNYEWSLLVLGVEAELAAIDLEDSDQDTAVEGIFGRGDDSIASFDTSLYAAVTGRVGLSVDRFLGYVKGGVAFADVEASFTDDSFDDVTGAALEAQSNDEWLTGFTVGGGVEMAVNPNFSLRGEYMYTEFDEGVTTTGTDLLGREFEFEHDVEDLHMGKFAATYRF